MCDPVVRESALIELLHEAVRAGGEIAGSPARGINVVEDDRDILPSVAAEEKSLFLSAEMLTKFLLLTVPIHRICRSVVCLRMRSTSSLTVVLVVRRSNKVLNVPLGGS